MARIFLSYASEQRDLADSINLSLIGRGHDVFFDRDDLPKGRTFERQIERGLERSHLLVFLISPEAVQEGRFTLTELKLARAKWPSPHGRVLPVMARPTPMADVPAYLKAVTILEPSGSPTAEIAATVQDMLDHLGRRHRTWRMAISAAALVAVIALAAISYERFVSPQERVADSDAPGQVVERCAGPMLYQRIANGELTYSEAKRLGEACAKRVLPAQSEGSPAGAEERERFARDFAVAATSESATERVAAAEVTREDSDGAIDSFFALARAATDPETKARHYRSAGILAQFSDPERATRAFEKLVELDPDDLAAWSALSNLYWGAGRQADADRVGAELAQRAGQAGGIDWQASAALQDAQRLISQGRFDSARQKILDGRRLYQQSGNRWGTAQSLIAEGELALMQGNLDTAAAHADDALAIARNYAFKDIIANAVTLKGRSRLFLFDLDEAESMFKEAAALYDEINNPHGAAFVANQLGLLEINRGNLDKARDIFESVREQQRVLNNKAGVAWARMSLGQVAHMRSSLEEARTSYSAARDEFAAIGNPAGEGASIMALAQLSSQLGQQQQALQELNRAQAIGEANALPSMEAQARAGKAYVYRLQDKTADSLQEYERALQLYGSVQNRTGQLFVLEQLGQVASSIDDTEAARDYWTRALALSRELGIDETVRRIEFELSQIGE